MCPDAVLYFSIRASTSNSLLLFVSQLKSAYLRVIFETRISTDQRINNDVFNDRGKINTYQHALFQKTLAPQVPTFIA